jgi:hypothetical protein
VQSLAVYPALAGVRGAPALDVEALLDTLLRFAEQFAGTGGALSEVDLNPVMVSDAGVFVVDALVRFASDGPSVQED